MIFLQLEISVELGWIIKRRDEDEASEGLELLDTEIHLADDDDDDDDDDDGFTGTNGRDVILV